MSLTSTLPRCSFAVMLLVVAAACSQAHPTPTVVLSEPPVHVTSASSSASSSASASPAPRKPTSPTTAAWTDPGALAQLAKDCSWAPAADQDGSDALSCEIHPEQSCNYNECDADMESCLPRCTACQQSVMPGCDRFISFFRIY